jgi:dTDP-glucose 4,6-dehydratase
MRVLITGGAGFIGSNFVNMALTDQFPEITEVKVIDKLTYAGKLSNLNSAIKHSNFEFIPGDICDPRIIGKLIQEVDAVINFAAESHVDRSILNSGPFVKTNILGTQVLLDAIKPFKEKRFIQISTDEVYGSISKGSWDEGHSLQPNSPYSASKASADLLVRSYFITHGLNTSITRCSNNFGPNQDSEKLIPNIITKLNRGEKVSLYGDGMNVRDWLYVADHCKGIYLVLMKGDPGEIYNIGGGTELTNLDLTRKLLKLMNKSEDWINFVEDRLGHDLRYSVSYKKIQKLGYSPSSDFDDHLSQTVKHYLGAL